MSPDEYRAATLAISRQTDTPLDGADGRLALYGLGIAGEAGEVADEIKKVLFHMKDRDPVKIANEVGDVLWYADRVLAQFGLTMSDAMTANVAKLRARYPEGWDAAQIHHGFNDDHGAVTGEQAQP